VKEKLKIEDDVNNYAPVANCIAEPNLEKRVQRLEII